VLASQGFGLLMFEAFPGQMRMAMSACSLLGVMQFSLAGFSFPVSAMYEPFQWLADIFPLHHYFVIYVNQALNGYSISYVWGSVVILIFIYLLPQFFAWRLKDAMLHKNYRE
jgi:ABC-2 type transport system permease protein